jgi:hypothetical protein
MPIKMLTSFVDVSASHSDESFNPFCAHHIATHVSLSLNIYYTSFHIIVCVRTSGCIQHPCLVNSCSVKRFSFAPAKSSPVRARRCVFSISLLSVCMRASLVKCMCARSKFNGSLGVSIQFSDNARSCWTYTFQKHIFSLRVFQPKNRLNVFLVLYIDSWLTFYNHRSIFCVTMIYIVY